MILRRSAVPTPRSTLYFFLLFVFYFFCQIFRPCGDCLIGSCYGHTLPAPRRVNNILNRLWSMPHSLGLAGQKSFKAIEGELFNHLSSEDYMSNDNATVMNGILGKLYKTFTAPDAVNGTASENNQTFFSFAAPGIPVDASTFDFLSVANRDQLNAASDFAQVVNFIPAPTGFWSTANRETWDAYQDALNQAVTPEHVLSAEDQSDLDSARAFLFDSVSRVSPVTHHIQQITQPSQAYQDYKAAEAAYVNANLAFNNKRIYINTHPNDQAAVLDWEANAHLYELQVTGALGNWEAANKGDVEDAISAIDRITGKSPATYFANLKNRLLLSQQTDARGGTFYETDYFPKNFWQPDFNSWTTFTFEEDEAHDNSEFSATSWGGGVSGGWGLWSWGVNVQHSHSESSDQSDTSNLKLSVEMVQIPLLRGWWDPTMFYNHGWKFATDDPLSNGLMPPATNGRLPMYVSSIIVARNLKASLDMTSTHNHSVSDHFSSSGSIGWGPFSLRGNYERNSGSHSHDFDHDASSISCPGMQIIAFVCTVLPKTPNPAPGLFPAPAHGLFAASPNFNPPTPKEPVSTTQPVPIDQGQNMIMEAFSAIAPENRRKMRRPSEQTSKRDITIPNPETPKENRAILNGSPQELRDLAAPAERLP